MGKRVCVIGGGVSGLTAAYLLKQKGIDVTLFESSSRVGGNIRSERKNGFLLEHGPNSLLRSPRMVDLIDSLDLRKDVLPASTSAKRRYVLTGGTIKPLPTSGLSFVTGDFFSTRAKLRMLKEPFVRTKSSEGESVAGFFERRLGREVVEKAADPFISGIFAGDPARLSIAEAFPTLTDLESRYGSLLLGAIRGKSEKADPGFARSFTFRNGVSGLTERLQERLGESVKTNCSAVRIERVAERFSVSAINGDSGHFDSVIISTRADIAADLLTEKEVVDALRGIDYAPVTVVRTAYAELAVGRQADGFGFLVPRTEDRKILGSLWTSSVFPDRAPADVLLFTTFVGGARAPHFCDLSDEDSFALVHQELATIMGISAPPLFTDLTKWDKAIPQYNIGYKETIDRLERFTEENPGMFFCSNFYRGISVGDCVKNAYRTADEAEMYLKTTQ